MHSMCIMGTVVQQGALTIYCWSYEGNAGREWEMDQIPSYHWERKNKVVKGCDMLNIFQKLQVRDFVHFLFFFFLFVGEKNKRIQTIKNPDPYSLHLTS